MLLHQPTWMTVPFFLVFTGHRYHNSPVLASLTDFLFLPQEFIFDWILCSSLFWELNVMKTSSTFIPQVDETCSVIRSTKAVTGTPSVCWTEAQTATTVWRELHTWRLYFKVEYKESCDSAMDERMWTWAKALRSQRAQQLHSTRQVCSGEGTHSLLHSFTQSFIHSLPPSLLFEPPRNDVRHHHRQPADTVVTFKDTWWLSADVFAPLSSTVWAQQDYFNLFGNYSCCWHEDRDWCSYGRIDTSVLEEACSRLCLLQSGLMRMETTPLPPSLVSLVTTGGI